MLSGRKEAVSVVIVVLQVALWLLQGGQKQVVKTEVLRCDEKPKVVVPDGCYLKRLPPV